MAQMMTTEQARQMLLFGETDPTYYPVQPPIMALQRFAAVLLRQAPPDKARMAKDAWLVLGYCQGLLLADPDTPATAGQSQSESMSNSLILADLPGPLTHGEVAQVMLSMSSTCAAQSVLGGIGLAVGKRFAAILLPYLIGWLKDYLLKDGGLEKLIGEIGQYLGGGAPTAPSPGIDIVGEPAEEGGVRRGPFGGIFRR